MNISDISSYISTSYADQRPRRMEDRISQDSGSVQASKLSDEEQKQVVELKKTDQLVRSHEQAHIAAGGSYVRGGASFQYQTGPDGKRYAVGGEVSVDTSPIKGNPRATIVKMETIKRAALAPAQPSGQDRSVAAQANAAQAQARKEMQSGSVGQSSGSGSSPQMQGTNSADAVSKTGAYTRTGTATPLAPTASTMSSAIDLLA